MKRLLNKRERILLEPLLTQHINHIGSQFKRSGDGVVISRAIIDRLVVRGYLITLRPGNLELSSYAKESLVADMRMPEKVM